MERPEASPAAEELYAALAPAFTAADEEYDWVSLNVCRALVAGRIDLLWELLIDDVTNREQWQIVFDPKLCPAQFLPYLAQFDGAVFRPEMSTAERRAAIERPEAFGRGTVAQIEAIVKRSLTGTKFVEVEERPAGNAWHLKIVTIESETPDQARLEAEVIADAKPIGIVLFFNRVIPWTWEEVIKSEATWATVQSSYATWALLRSHEP